MMQADKYLSDYAAVPIKSLLKLSKSLHKSTCSYNLRNPMQINCGLIVNLTGTWKLEFWRHFVDFLFYSSQFIFSWWVTFRRYGIGPKVSV
jgi:hypothetical protein